MSEKENTYQKIFKSASLFGIVQLSNLLISVVRSKFLAVLIGPAGYGVFSLLNSTIDLARQATGFSLDVSGVKKIAESNSANDTEKVAKNASILLRLSFITGIVGVVTVVLLSPLLSQWTFGNSSEVTAFLLIAVSILFRQVTGSQIAVLQGVSKLRYLANANLWGNFLGLLVTLPLYILFKIDAIVPSIILSSIVSFIFSTFYYKKAGIIAPSVSFKESLIGGKEILFFGGLLSASAFLPLLSNYLVQLYINTNSGLEQVGLFNIGLLIVNTYVGIIFNAMSTEYYPRLAALGTDNSKTSNAVNQQAILSMLIILPIIILFLGGGTFIIQLLFSERFSASMDMTSWMVIAMFFKAVSWSMGYVIIARADSKVFVKTSVIFSCIYLLFCLLGYRLYGLEGIGIGLLCYYVLHLIAIYGITYYRYKIRLSSGLYKIFWIGTVICVLAILLNQLSDDLVRLPAYLVLFLVSVLFSFKEIDKRVDLKSIFMKLKNKIRK
jgi:O-antigen/teichoic acid export membrane protein